ncbi:hypothetical protein A6A04_18970 [Paramagnetospirillum marisnigri]|uniref:Uncharacterized protein n=1 Tax=Paramagnetospirillum marisnigri TaxID=1285242 RepID=A0A178MM91_9PROT|nr:hypothetical protein [Paramagnetospirillum marisnigri]OAN49653.1 hypothetical protein A6A04_18970 [Paramagnetospirillum marisnigri]
MPYLRQSVSACFLLGLALVGLSVPAWAELDARAYVARRLAADHHVQVRIDGFEAKEGSCRIRAEVLRRFGGRGPALETGSDITFGMPCAEASFWPAARLKETRLLELYLKSGPAGLDVADEGQGARALDAVSDAPAIRDDPALVRDMTETIAAYSIDSEVKRNNPDAALALARVADPHSRLRLLAHAAGALATRKSPLAEAAAAEVMTAFDALPADEARLAAGLAALEPLALGGLGRPSLHLAERLGPDVDALLVPGARDAALLSLYGARIRSDDPAGAFVALAKLTDRKARRERLDDMPFAQKDFGPGNPASPGWLDRLLAAVEGQPDAEFRGEAVLALCRTAYRSAAGMAQVPELMAKAVPMAELAARRRHGPSAVLLAVLSEALGGDEARARAARWYAVAGVGFDVATSSRSEAIRILSGFTVAERAAAARMLGGSGAATPHKLLELAAK